MSTPTGARKITPELMKAEAALGRLDAAWGNSQEAHQARWHDKRLRLIHSFTDDVTEGLVALKVISGDDVQEAAEHVQGGP